jgi:hypothetical protein
MGASLPPGYPTDRAFEGILLPECPFLRCTINEL